MINHLKEVVGEQLRMNSSEISPETSLIDPNSALGMDIRHHEIILAINEAFGVEISDDDAAAMLTVQDAINYLDTHL